MPDIEGPEVEAWLLEHVPGLVGPLHLERLTGGFSNRTYLVSDAAAHRAVLRCPPAGAVAAGAHDVIREHRILEALAPTAVRTPAPLAACADTAISDVPFYVMAFAAGAVVASERDVLRALPEDASRRAASRHVVDTLADLHALDIDAIGLGGLARRDGFVARQLASMERMWAQRGRDDPLVDEVGARLAAACPPQHRTSIVHADFRLGNLVLTPEGAVAAVLDWELSTLGDPLADLAYLLNNWELPGDDHRQVWMEQPPTAAGGFLDREAIVARYVARTAADVGDLPFHRALAYWKVAIIAEGIRQRAVGVEQRRGGPDSAFLVRRVTDLAWLADRHLRTIDA